MYYTEKDGVPVISNFLEMTTWKFQNPGLVKVGRTNGIASDGHPAIVSTVFLGVSASFGDNSSPYLYETMTFSYLGEDTTKRYTNRADAIDGHWQTVKSLLGDSYIDAPDAPGDEENVPPSTSRLRFIRESE